MPSGVYERKKKCPLKRFSEKYAVNVTNGCWEWFACISPQGYGQFWDGNEYVLAHRFSYETYRGHIPCGLVIDHLCRNRCCVNPYHLEVVTMGENTNRGTARRVIAEKKRKQTHCKRGHHLSGANLKVDKKGHRMCKECQREKAKQWKKKNRERVNFLQRKRRAKTC